METKRLILAVALSFIVIVLYQMYFLPKPAKQVPVTATTEVQGKSAAGQNNPTGAAKPNTENPGENPDIFSKTEKKTVEETPQIVVEEDLKESVAKDIVVETELYKAVFTNKGAGLKSFVLKKFNDDQKKPMDLISAKVNEKFGNHEVYPFYFSPFEDMPVLLDINRQHFKYQGEPQVYLLGKNNKSASILFQYADVAKGIKVLKRFTLYSNNYVLHVDYDVVINGKPMPNIPIIFGPDLENNVSKSRVMQAGLRAAYYDGENVNDKVFSTLKIEALSQGKESVQTRGSFGDNYYWSAYDTTYFAVMFKTRENMRQVKYALVKTANKSKDKNQPAEKLFSYIIMNHPESVYMGPKDEKILGELEQNYNYPEANKLVHYGWSLFGVIAKLLLKGIMFIHGFIPNMGWALVIFTVFIKILLFPLTYASSVSMAKMATLQPKLKAIKKKYKNLRDPEQRKQMNLETMALYKQEKVNPAGGCLPLLLQMPILFAFFSLLPVSVNFRHEGWILWLSDLSVKDPFYVLPILMGATQIIVSMMTPSTGDSTQKKMMYIMPVVMVFLFMNYSSGLNLYWFISNFLQIGQQYIINKKIFTEKKEEDRERRMLKRKKGVKVL